MRSLKHKFFFARAGRGGGGRLSVQQNDVSGGRTAPINKYCEGENGACKLMLRWGWTGSANKCSGGVMGMGRTGRANYVVGDRTIHTN